MRNNSRMPSSTGASNRPTTRTSELGDAVRYAEVFGLEASLARANFNPTKFDPLLYHLPKVKWAVVGTVTWRRASRRSASVRAMWLRKQDFNGVLYRACTILGLRVKDIAIYWTTEFGVACKCHIHFLVARDGLENITPESFSRVFGQLWTVGFRPIDGGPGGVGRAEVLPYDQAQGHKGVAYCLKHEFDEVGQKRERYDFLSAKLKKIIRAVIDQPIVPSLLSPHMAACSGSGRIFGQNCGDFENADHVGPHQCARPETRPLPTETVVNIKRVPSDQTGLNLLVEAPLSARLGALRN